MPVQPVGSGDTPGMIVLDQEWAEGLNDLQNFSHIIALYYFHRQSNVSLTVTPFLDNQPHGLFATRAPCRPNPIGISVLRLKNISGCNLEVEGVDVIDGTPLLDIKPYVPLFDQPDGDVRVGWLEGVSAAQAAHPSDSRFGGK